MLSELHKVPKKGKLLWGRSYVNIYEQICQFMPFHVIIYLSSLTQLRYKTEFPIAQLQDIDSSDGRAVCSAISHVRGSSPILAWNFFQLGFLHNCINYSFHSMVSLTLWMNEWMNKCSFATQFIILQSQSTIIIVINKKKGWMLQYLWREDPKNHLDYWRGPLILLSLILIISRSACAA